MVQDVADGVVVCEGCPDQRKGSGSQRHKARDAGSTRRLSEAAGAITAGGNSRCWTGSATSATAPITRCIGAQNQGQEQGKTPELGHRMTLHGFLSPILSSTRLITATNEGERRCVYRARRGGRAAEASASERSVTSGASLQMRSRTQSRRAFRLQRLQPEDHIKAFIFVFGFHSANHQDWDFWAESCRISRTKWVPLIPGMMWSVTTSRTSVRKSPWRKLLECANGIQRRDDEVSGTPQNRLSDQLPEPRCHLQEGSLLNSASQLQGEKSVNRSHRTRSFSKIT